MKSSHGKKIGLSYRASARKTPHTNSTAGMPAINTRFGDPGGPIVRDRNRRSRLRNVTGKLYPGTGVTVTAPRPHDARGARGAARAGGVGSPRPGAATTWSKHRQGSAIAEGASAPKRSESPAGITGSPPQTRQDGDQQAHVSTNGFSAGREHHVFGGEVAARLGSGGSFGAEAAGSGGVRASGLRHEVPRTGPRDPGGCETSGLAARRRTLPDVDPRPEAVAWRDICSRSITCSRTRWAAVRSPRIRGCCTQLITVSAMRDGLHRGSSRVTSWTNCGGSFTRETGSLAFGAS